MRGSPLGARPSAAWSGEWGWFSGIMPGSLWAVNKAFYSKSTTVGLLWRSRVRLAGLCCDMLMPVRALP